MEFFVPNVVLFNFLSFFVIGYWGYDWFVSNLVFEIVCVICGCIVGGESTADNCQILQTRVNRFKSDKEQVDATKLKGFSCDVKFTGIYALFSFFSFVM